MAKLFSNFVFYIMV
uniref:Uncharacterized protein n=1 Tax=Arundo donax TaxID=35708 RepID=A0A0A9BWN1_ARUDO